MTTQTLTLTAFLLERIAEDEAAARALQGQWSEYGGRWYVCDDGHLEQPIGEWEPGEDRLPNHHNNWHLALDPARVLAECEAKRRIVALHQPEGGYRAPDNWYGDQNDCQECGHIEVVAGLGQRGYQRTWPCRTLRLLALSYADHPDYNPDWRP